MVVEITFKMFEAKYNTKKFYGIYGILWNFYDIK